MKSTNMLNLSFKDSNKIVQERYLIKDFYTFDKTTKVTWLNSNHNFFVRFVFSCVFLGFSLGFYILGILYNAKSATDDVIVGVNIQNTQVALDVANSIRPILTTLEIIVLIMGILQVLPNYNFPWMKISGFAFFAPFCIFAMFAIFPMGLGLMLQHWGKVASLLVIIFLGIFLISYPINEWRKKVYKLTKNGNYLGFFAIFKVIFSFLVICLLISCFTHFDSFDGLIAGSLLFIFEIAFYITFYLCLDSLLTYYYILKYPKEYRIYYRISDDAWWISTRRANKHEHVYPIPDKKKEKING